MLEIARLCTLDAIGLVKRSEREKIKKILRTGREKTLNRAK